MTKKTEDVSVNADDTTTALVTQSAEDTSFLLGELAHEQEVKATPFVIPRLAVYVPGKKGTDQGANRGLWIDFLDGQNYDVNIEKFRFYRLDLPIMARIMWGFDPADGSKLQGDEFKDPWCGSSDGISPRQGDRFNYVGKTYVDYRDHKPYTITNSCNGCVFQQWRGMYDEDGTAVMESDGRGNLRTKNGKPPCDPTPKFVLFDVDRKRPVLFQTTGFVRNTHVLGSGPRGRFGAILGINDYYNAAPDTKRPMVVDEQGRLHALIMTVKMVNAGGSNGYQPAPVFSVDPEPMNADELKALRECKELYTRDNGRAAISGHAYGVDFNNDEYVQQPYQNNDPVTADSPF